MRVCVGSKLQTPCLQSLDQNQPIRKEVLFPMRSAFFLNEPIRKGFQNLDPFVFEFSISSYLFIFLPRTKMVREEIGVLNRRYLACQISAIKFAKCARSRDFFTLIAANCQ